MRVRRKSALPLTAAGIGGLNPQCVAVFANRSSLRGRTKAAKVRPPRARVKSAKVRPTPYVYYFTPWCACRPSQVLRQNTRVYFSASTTVNTGYTYITTGRRRRDIYNREEENVVVRETRECVKPCQVQAAVWRERRGAAASCFKSASSSASCALGGAPCSPVMLA